MVPTEDFKQPSFEEMQSLASWQHFIQNILKEGRLVHIKPEIGENEEEEKVMKQVEERDPFEPRLKPISSDMRIFIIFLYNLHYFYNLFNVYNLFNLHQFDNLFNLHYLFNLFNLNIFL